MATEVPPPPIQAPMSSGQDPVGSTAWRAWLQNITNVLNGITEQLFNFSDVTTADVSTTKHGLCPKAPGSVGQVLKGNGLWGGLLSTRTDRLAPALGAVYHNTGGLMYVYVAVDVGVVAKSDSTASPTKVSDAGTQVRFFVIPGDYYTVYDASGTGTISQWTEWT